MPVHLHCLKPTQLNPKLPLSLTHTTSPQPTPRTTLHACTSPLSETQSLHKQRQKIPSSPHLHHVPTVQVPLVNLFVAGPREQHVLLLRVQRHTVVYLAGVEGLQRLHNQRVPPHSYGTDKLRNYSTFCFSGCNVTQ